MWAPNEMVNMGQGSLGLPLLPSKSIQGNFQMPNGSFGSVPVPMIFPPEVSFPPLPYFYTPQNFGMYCGSEKGYNPLSTPSYAKLSLPPPKTAPQTAANPVLIKPKPFYIVPSEKPPAPRAFKPFNTLFNSSIIHLLRE
jgi:hypothetical protein